MDDLWAPLGESFRFGRAIYLLFLFLFDFFWGGGGLGLIRLGMTISTLDPNNIIPRIGL